VIEEGKLALLVPTIMGLGFLSAPNWWVKVVGLVLLTPAALVCLGLLGMVVAGVMVRREGRRYGSGGRG